MLLVILYICICNMVLFDIDILILDILIVRVVVVVAVVVVRCLVMKWMFVIVCCHINITDVCCLDTNIISNKETKANTKVMFLVKIPILIFKIIL